MNKLYSKPVVLLNEDLAEGVYAASGGVASSDCWTADAYIHQTPETGRNDYRIQVNAYHTNPENHRSGAIVTIVFNQSVTVTNAGGGSQVYGNSTGSTISVKFDIGTYNSNESKGWGDLTVTSGDGLEIVDVGIQCTGI